MVTAFDEFYHHGFQGGSLNRIVEQAATTKGALFHHFKGKSELGYAVVDEILYPTMKEGWITPLENSDNPVRDLKQIIATSMQEKLAKDPDLLCNGCPLNNFAQEMSPLDEKFRTRIENVYTAWRGAIERSFQAGLKKGTVKRGVSPKKVAAFFVAALSGIIGTGKNAQSLELMMDAGEALLMYLDSLKP